MKLTKFIIIGIIFFVVSCRNGGEEKLEVIEKNFEIKQSDSEMQSTHGKGLVSVAGSFYQELVPIEEAGKLRGDNLRSMNEIAFEFLNSVDLPFLSSKYSNQELKQKYSISTIESYIEKKHTIPNNFVNLYLQTLGELYANIHNKINSSNTVEIEYGLGLLVEAKSLNLPLIQRGLQNLIDKGKLKEAKHLANQLKSTRDFEKLFNETLVLNGDQMMAMEYYSADVPELSSSTNNLRETLEESYNYIIGITKM